MFPGIRFFIAALLLSGCTTAQIARDYAHIPAVRLSERGIQYVVRISYENEEVLVAASEGPLLGDILFDYGQRQLDIPEARLGLAGRQRNNAKRAVRRALNQVGCNLSQNGDGSTVFFALTSTLYIGDITCHESPTK